jgi:multiple antibiotic resistance protein
VTGLIEYFFVAIAAVFVIINPLTTAFVFASLTPYAAALPWPRSGSREA